MKSTFDRLSRILVAHIDPPIIEPNSTWEDLEADSLETISVLMAVEKEFRIEIPEDADLETVGDVIHFIERHSPQ